VGEDVLDGEEFAEGAADRVGGGVGVFFVGGDEGDSGGSGGKNEVADALLVDGDDGVAGGALEFGVDETAVDGLAGFCVDHADGDGLGGTVRAEAEHAEEERSRTDCVHGTGISARDSVQRGPHGGIIGAQGRVLL